MVDIKNPKNHNRALKKALQKIEASIAQAQDDTDLVVAINLLQDFETPVKFDNRPAHILSIPLLIISLCATYFGSQDPEIEIMLIVGSIVGAITLVSYLWVIFSRRMSFADLSDTIQAKTILFDNNL
jgi:hypothetical protein